MLDKATVAAVARELGRSWDTVNDIAVTATEELLATAGPARLDGVRVIGVDEHRWAHVRSAQADGFVTVITDLTDVLTGQGPAPLLDMVPGRSAAAMTDWLAGRHQRFREQVEIVASSVGHLRVGRRTVPPCGGGGAASRRWRCRAWRRWVSVSPALARAAGGSAPPDRGEGRAAARGIGDLGRAGKRAGRILTSR
jgi:hypothetical protein